MKKILMSVFAIAAAASVAGIGSWALWNDTESVEGNYVQAGYLDLQVDSVLIEISNVYPGQEGSKTVGVKNNSTICAKLSVKADYLENFENWCVEPEKNEGGDTTCSLQTNMSIINNILSTHNYVGGIHTGAGVNDYDHHLGRGELAENIIIDSVAIGSVTIPVNKTLYDLYNSGATYGSYYMAAGEADVVTINWHVSADGEGGLPANIFMTDAVRGTFSVMLEQASTSSTECPTPVSTPTPGGE